MQKGSQALLTFIVGGRLALKGANAGSKKEIRKIMKFRGCEDPITGVWGELLNEDNFRKAKKPLPYYYYRSHMKYVEPTYHQVVRKLRWTPDQVEGLLSIPVGMSEKQWSKLKDEQKLQLHANNCLLPGETAVTVDLFV